MGVDLLVLWLVDLDVHGTPLDRWSVGLHARVPLLEVELMRDGCLKGGLFWLFEVVGLTWSHDVEYRG